MEVGQGPNVGCSAKGEKKLPVVLYGCENWSVTLREEHRVRVLRRIFGRKGDEVTGGWRKLHNEELHYL
jgi:hypothetical protein